MSYMKTKSEELFDYYCELMQYKCDEIQAGPEHGKTPDRLVHAEGVTLIVEIKELTPNEDDKRQAEELARQGMTVSNERPGKRIQEKIRKAAPQLRKYRNKKVPLVLVLYDNIVLDGHIPNGFLEPHLVDFSMYGLQTAVFIQELNELKHIGRGRGGRRQTTPTERTYLSAIAILYEIDRHSPFLYVYHNYFAEAKLPFEVFSGHKNRHFVKSVHPNYTPQQWTEVTL